MRPTLSFSRVLTLAATLSACGDEEAPARPAQQDIVAQDAAGALPGFDAETLPSTTPDSGVSPPAAHEGTTYADVAPILARACLHCHSPGKIAPFALDSFEKAAPFAPLLATAVRARTMPPSVIDNSGACNTFKDVTWLSEEEITTFERWAEEGAKDGTPTASTVVPPLPALAGDVKILRTPPYTPSKAQKDDYRCFVIDSPFDAETFVTGFDMVPANAQTAHHMVVFYPMDDVSAYLSTVLDDLEEGPGYTCFGSPSVPATILAAWAPGGGATNYPAGLGIRVDPGRPLIVQMHYNTVAVATPTEEVTEVALSVKKDGIEPAYFMPLLDLDITLEPGKSSAVKVVTGKIADKLPEKTGPVEVYGVFPHMHELGKNLTVSVKEEGARERCMLEAPRYSFHWQRLYMFDEPLKIDAHAPIDIRCDYDTTSRTEVTKWGEGTQDEMCVAGLFVKL